jgi:lipopolysaccharide assembly protein A
MQHILWLLRWILKAAIFFTLFAFALNNQHEVTAHFFFGKQWNTPLIVLVLIAFTAGLVLGVLGMVPRWWKHRRAAFTASQMASQLSAMSQFPEANTMLPEARKAGKK